MEIDDRIRLRSWGKLKYYDSESILRRFREYEIDVYDLDIDDKVKTLRTSILKKHKYGREAALFCYGLGYCVLNVKVYFIRDESEDYDFVATWTEGINQIYAPVQMKELVPHDVNEGANLQKIIDMLAEYKKSDNTMACIYLNRRELLKLEDLVIPKLSMACLWFFGSATPDQSKWFLYGDMTREPKYHEFFYPA